jgi:rSAM/selenodomain-associated transferase 1
MARDCVVIMAREPRPGFVKTRLAETLGNDVAASLYRAFLRDTIDACAQVSSNTMLSYADETADASRFFEEFAPRLPRSAQPDTDFGTRLAAAMEAGFAAGYRRVALIGSDIPHISPGWIANAFAQLERADVVLGPTIDGGYYLIAAKQPAPALFEAIDWSSGREFAQTVDRAAALGLTVEFGKTTFDVDEFRDVEALQALIAERGPSTCPATAAALSHVETVAGRAMEAGTR